MTRLGLTVSSGFGPVEVRRFAGALAETIARELRARGASDVCVVTHGDHGAPRSVDIMFEGPRSLAAGLVGTHALVARSDERAKRDRKRWYVGVSCAEVLEDGNAPLRAYEITYEACRARGPGGQHVNRTESAVRATHRPSGLSVRVESERSQLRNKNRARELLAGALARAARERKAAESEARRGRALRVERGNPIATWRVDAGGLSRIDRGGRSDAR